MASPERQRGESDQPQLKKTPHADARGSPDKRMPGDLRPPELSRSESRRCQSTIRTTLARSKVVNGAKRGSPPRATTAAGAAAVEIVRRPLTYRWPSGRSDVSSSTI